MPARIPIIFNPSTGNIEEIVTADSMQLDMQTDIKFVTETVVGTSLSSSLAVSSGILVIDTSQGTVFIGSLSSSVTTWSFTNVPTTNNKLLTVSLIIQGSVAYSYGDACSVNGTAITGGVKWYGGFAPTATNNIDMISFIILRDGNGTLSVIGNQTINIS